VAQVQLTHDRAISIQDLKELSSDPGPCITVLLPLHPEDTRQIQAAVKSAIRAVEQRLEQRHEDRKQVDALMESLRALPGAMEIEPGQKGVAILRSPSVLQRFLVPGEVEESITVGRHFHLVPLIQHLSETRPFYILALSQKHIRLLRCTNTTSEEVNLPPSVPRSLDDYLQTDKPDHVLDNASAGGPGTGSMNRVMFGTGTEKQRKEQYLLHFYKEVDRGVTDLLEKDTAPLVIAGVEYEIPLYRTGSVFPRLVDDAVRGAPDGLKGGELHKRALEVMRAHWAKAVEGALAMYEQLGSGRASADLKEIVKAAYDGRVLHLFVAQGTHHMGNFDEVTHAVHTHGEEQPGDEDLINAAAVETLRHAGDVFDVPPAKVPHGSPMAAVMRY
jgi:hypothetical protein